MIPEKAASFSIHPDRLCQDQCFYCGGKFGLFDTPLHIAQMKSQERQKKILDSKRRTGGRKCKSQLTEPPLSLSLFQARRS